MTAESRRATTPAAVRNGMAAVGAVLFLLLVLRNAWLGDDCYIIFRTIEQLFAGHGLRWNLVDRVQTFTSPLWFWVLCVARIFSKEIYLNVVVVSLLFDSAVLALLWRRLGNSLVWALALLVLAVSNSFMDYTTAGLEYPLIYVLVMIVFGEYLGAAQARAEQAPWRLLAASGLLLATRHDLLLTVILPVLHVVWSRWHQWRLQHGLTVIVVLFGPLALWTLFSLVYYGVPVPNTAYAKLGIGAPHLQLMEQGVQYFINGAQYDLISILVMILAVMAGFLSRRTEYCVVSATILLVCAYIVWVGADFMAGRFYAHLVLLSVLMLGMMMSQADPGKVSGYPLFAGMVVLLLYGAFYPHTPTNSPSIYDRQFVNHGISDERGFYSGATSIWRYAYPEKSETGFFPNTYLVKNAQAYGKDGKSYAHEGGIGLVGYYAPQDFYIDDYYALSDFFRARLPLLGDAWVIGHSPRYYPEGYIDSMLTGQNRIVEPHLREYYEVVRLLTQDNDLFASERLWTILRFNLGFYDHLLKDADIARPNPAVIFNNQCRHSWRDLPALKRW